MSTTTSLLSTTILFALLVIGTTGTHDPLENLLPLMMWTGFWIALVLLHGLSGNLWHWINPWAGAHAVLRPILDRLKLRRPERNGAASSGAEHASGMNSEPNVLAGDAGSAALLGLRPFRSRAR